MWFSRQCNKNLKFNRSNKNKTKTESVDEFHCISTRLGVKVKKGRSQKCYWATPLSDLAVSHHLERPRDNGSENGTHKYTLCLANIRGLITKEINKVPILEKMAKLSERGKIVSLTETHLIKDQHYKEEITDYLPNFNMARTDRDIKFDPTDEKALKSRGGTLILGSPDI